MAELYVTAEEVGIDPNPEFEAAGGGVPANFHITSGPTRPQEARFYGARLAGKCNVLREE
jgi:hypothetical protein